MPSFRPCRRLFWLFVTLLSALPPAFVARADDNLDERIAIEEAMRRANDYYIANFALGTAVWNRGAYQAGNFRAYKVLGIQAYLDEAVAWATANNWAIGPEAGGGADADSMTCGQTYIDLYKIDPQPVRIASIQAKLDALKASSTSVDDWTWVDAFFMAGPTFAYMGTLKTDSTYYDQMDSMYYYMRNTTPTGATTGLFSSTYGLWYRDSGAKNRTGAYVPEFWGRGNGWAIAACARILEQLPVNDPRRTEYQNMLKTMAAALLPLQQSDGFWRSGLLFPDQYSNPETSGTAFFTYGITYGINEGLLDPAIYTPVILKAWQAMVTTALHANGELGYVQAIGAAPGSATYDSDQDYGYGAFLLAGCEILRMLGGPVPVSPDAGADITLTDTDANYVESVTLNASGSVLRSGSIVSYSWWVGSIYLGSGAQLPVEFPYGTWQVTLKVVHSDGNTYTDTRTVKVQPPNTGIIVTAIGYQDPNAPANTIDGSFESRWSQEGDRQWIQYEFPEAATIDHVDIAFYLGNSRATRFYIAVSTNGTNWTNATSSIWSSGTASGFETFSFTARTAKYVRIYGRGNTTNNFTSITEVKFPVTIAPTLTDETDADNNGLPDSWEVRHFGATGQNPAATIAGTSTTVGTAYLDGEDPVTPDANADTLKLEVDSTSQLPVLVFKPRAAFGAGFVGKVRKYKILTSSTMADGSWQPLAGYESIAADNVVRRIPISADARAKFYRAEITLE